MRRGVPSNRRFVAGPGRWTPSGKSGLLSWMRGDDPGASINETPDPDQYAAIPDRGSLGGSFAQATSGDQPQVSTVWTPGPAPLFGGGRRLVHTANASEFVAIQHDGLTEVLIGIRFRVDSSTGASRALWGTRVTGRGFLFTVTDAGALSLVYHDGTTVQSVNSSSGVVANGTAYSLTVRKTVTRATAWLGDTEVADAAFSIGASTDAPQNTAIVGASSAGGVAFPGAIPEIVVFAAANAADLPDRAQLRAHLDRRAFAG